MYVHTAHTTTVILKAEREFFEVGYRQLPRGGLSWRSCEMAAGVHMDRWKNVNTGGERRQQMNETKTGKLTP